MIEQSTQRKVVIFTGRYRSLSTIELIEALAEAFPNWELTILQEHKNRRWGVYLKGKLRRLMREPLSYPLELLAQLLSKLRLPSRGTVTGGVSLPQSYQQLAGQRITYLRCGSFAEPDFLREVAELTPWLGIALSAPVLRPELFTIPELGTVNLHKSLLPDYRGMPPGFWELHDGAQESGVSVHWVEKGLDSGAIIHQQRLSIAPYATCEGLSAELDSLSREVLLEALGCVERGEVQATPQPPASAKPNRRPTWRERQALQRKLRKRRRSERFAARWPRELAKRLLLGTYVYLWVPVRNAVRRLRGTCHTTVLLYHRVSDQYVDSVTVGTEQFKGHLQILRRRYEVVDMPTFLAGNGGRRRRPTVVISFDDGYADNLLAGRLLRRAGLPGVFFLSTRIVGTDRPFEHDVKKLGHRVPALSWDQVRQLAGWGFHLGNHTAEHVNLGQLPPGEGLEQVRIAQQDLQAHLGNGCVVPALAYPFGRREDISDEVRQGLSSLGVAHCFSAYGGVNPPNFAELNILRQAVDHNFSDLAFRAAVEGWTGRRSHR